MKSKSLTALQLSLWMVCLFHLALGAGLSLSTGMVDSAAKMYGAEVSEWSPQFLYILRPLGVFMLALSVFAAAAALDPLRHRLTIYVFAGIFIVRATQRLVFGAEIHDTFGIADSRNMGNMVFFFALAALLIVLDALSRRSHTAAPATAT